MNPLFNFPTRLLDVAEKEATGTDDWIASSMFGMMNCWKGSASKQAVAQTTCNREAFQVVRDHKSYPHASA